ncbi:MAG: 3-phosphoshikimate 1-carboxyvinyltransferase [Paracoccaceae bacterium]|nr:3-phosphoshikimate 1-carboxyvinyltransferase [Paracoccaceae bacterium]
MRSVSGNPLSGTAIIPGDKSISHRSLILGALSIGCTEIEGLLEGEDVLDTAEAMRSFGAHVIKHDNGNWYVDGVGVGGFAEPKKIIDCGNSGTGVRLILGAMATSPITATFSGDSSLTKRPMGRVINPLKQFGAQFYGRSGARLPLTSVGAKDPTPICFSMPIASAQVKSAILLAGLNAPGQTVVVEKELTRDHTERMLKGFGATIDIQDSKDGRRIVLDGYPELKSQLISVPRDPSSAAFPICAALITEGSDVLVPNIALNPTRAGLFKTLEEMGANIEYINRKSEGGEPVADLRVRFSALRGVEVPPDRAASMIDEYPILSVVASFAEGKTTMLGVKELRVKESDRIDAMARGLMDSGVNVEQEDDTLSVYGKGPLGVPGGADCVTFLDHRVAMSFLCLGLATKNPITIDDYSPVTTSFPNFKDLITNMGGQLEEL